MDYVALYGPLLPRLNLTVKRWVRDDFEVVKPGGMDATMAECFQYPGNV